ncbi:MAG: hypothetical protein AAB503_01280 [Patescibacteria group bacterium]
MNKSNQLSDVTQKAGIRNRESFLESIGKTLRRKSKPRPKKKKQRISPEIVELIKEISQNPPLPREVPSIHEL